MLIYILTTPARERLYKGTVESLIQVGIDQTDIRKVYGYDATTFYDKRKCLAKCFKDKMCISKENDFLYVEDGTLFNQNPINCIKDRSVINWLGFIKVTKTYIIGSKCLYIPKDHINGLEKAPLAHIDRMFMNYGKKNNCLHVYPHTIISLMEYDSAFGTPKQIESKNKMKAKLIRKKYKFKKI